MLQAVSARALQIVCVCVLLSENFVHTHIVATKNPDRSKFLNEDQLDRGRARTRTHEQFTSVKEELDGDGRRTCVVLMR